MSAISGLPRSMTFASSRSYSPPTRPKPKKSATSNTATPICQKGVLAEPEAFAGQVSGKSRQAIIDYLQKQNLATPKVNYKMRDWSVSRQRYWGAPIPIINCSKCGPVLVPDDQLAGWSCRSLMTSSRAVTGAARWPEAKDWLKVDCPKCGGKAERETDTLDTYICSSWYMYRYFDPHNQQRIFDSELAQQMGTN